MNEIKPIFNQTKPLFIVLKENAQHIIEWDWIFSTAFEKLIVASSLIWGIYSIGRFLYGLF